MSVCVLDNLEKYRVLWTDFLASYREISRFSVSKIGPEPAKPNISLALVATIGENFEYFSVQQFPMKLLSFGVQPITVPKTQSLQLQQDITVPSQLHPGFQVITINQHRDQCRSRP